MRKFNWAQTAEIAIRAALCVFIAVLLYVELRWYALYSWHSDHFPKDSHECHDKGLATICSVHRDISMGTVRQFDADLLGVYICAPGCSWFVEPYPQSE